MEWAGLATAADGMGLLPYIPHKSLFAAVQFALKMIRQGTPPGVANWRAASYYGVPVPDVAHYTGMVAGRAKATRGQHRREQQFR